MSSISLIEKSLTEVGEIVTGFTPSTSSPAYWNGDIPFYSPSDFSNAVVATNAEKKVSELGANFGRNIPKNAVMVTCIGSIGKIALCGKAGISNQQINSIIVNAEHDSRFVYYVILNGAHRLINIAPMTTIPILNKSEFGKLSFSFPPLPQQQKIAKILTTVDNLIEQTQALIEKYTAIKQGMMADLFTRGLDLTGTPTTNPLSRGELGGQLRLSVEDAPELYKETELGWVPKEWKIYSFGELADYKNGNSFKSSEWCEDGYPIIRIQNLNGSNEFNYYQGEIKPDWHVLNGDLLFAWSGQKGVSFGARIWSGEEGVLNQHIFKVTERAALLSRKFLYHLFKLNVGRIEDNAHGFKDSFLHVTRAELTSVKVALPPLAEQERIEGVAASIDGSIQIEAEKMDKYMQIKKGLMQDLLTGKVPVNA